MRIALEAVAIRVTVPVLTAADLAELDGLMAQMDHYVKLRDAVGYRDPHRQFHHRLVYAAGPRVSDEIDELFDHAERYRRRFGAADSWEARRAEHQAILDAVGTATARPRRTCSPTTTSHTVRLVFGELDPGHDLARLRETVAIVAPGAIDQIRDSAVLSPRRRARRRRSASASPPGPRR